MSSDFINSLLEMAGAALLCNNCRLLYAHKQVQGVSVLTTAFFLVWGMEPLFLPRKRALAELRRRNMPRRSELRLGGYGAFLLFEYNKLLYAILANFNYSISTCSAYGPF